MQNIKVQPKTVIKIKVSPIKQRFLQMAEYDESLNKIYQQTKKELRNGESQ
ncbi:hypothetical protein [Rodentibacter pneumotropicus]|uniref:hypothetical protein n=1 Tax=Rodentibacter pneumotropicus TaxID=758 RepID=UPI0024321238|nr:hypothetical protein [Rodentibacter pneumotropicus]